MLNDIERAMQLVDQSVSAQIRGERDEQPSIYVCPDCGGVLWQVDVDGYLEFRCHVGHILSALSLLEQQLAVVEAATWKGVRTLIDHSRLLRQLSVQVRRDGDAETVGRYERQAQAAENLSGSIQHLIETDDPAARVF